MSDHAEPVDPDVDLRVPRQRGEVSAALLGAIALGGALGALARWGLVAAWPQPWAVLLINTAGCGLIGVLMVWIERRGPHRLTRPFLGTGVLGGFTTFSTYAVDAHRLLTGGHALTGVLYLAGTLLAALAAAWGGARLARAVLR